MIMLMRKCREGMGEVSKGVIKSVFAVSCEV